MGLLRMTMLSKDPFYHQFRKSLHNFSTHLLRLAGGFHLVPSCPVSAYFTGFLALLTIRLVSSKIVIFQKNGVLNGVLDGRGNVFREK